MVHRYNSIAEKMGSECPDNSSSIPSSFVTVRGLNRDWSRFVSLCFARNNERIEVVLQVEAICAKRVHSSFCNEAVVFVMQRLRGVTFLELAPGVY